MEEEQYQVEIPSYFLCPISMQLMKDPVTISTGITYDRESIEKWLFSCKNTTCPVTKQPLSAAAGDLTPTPTPNHTLRRLIQSWCTLNALERIPTPKQSVEKSHILNLLNEAKNSPTSQQQLRCLQRLRSIARSNQLSTKLHMQAAGAPAFLLSVVGKRYSDDDGALRDEALSALQEMELSDSDLKSFFSHNDGSIIIDALIQLLRNGDPQNRGGAMALLKSAFAVADPVDLIRSRPEIFTETVRALRDGISARTAVKLLVELCPWGRNRVKAAKAGAVAALVELLLEETERRGCELALTALDQLCGCAEGRAELVGHGAGLAVVSKKILRVSAVASDRGVRIIGSISRHSANSRVLEEMGELGVVRKLCLVLQIEGMREKTRERVREILRLHARVWKGTNCSCIPPHLISYYPS
ncbi:hypothetical protein C2S51_013210 [Perilla frutescens var. frutescens]|nr:hypothetical protein C2S51_013210 [Perilla frutescens var. frutescens]